VPVSLSLIVKIPDIKISFLKLTQSQQGKSINSVKQKQKLLPKAASLPHV
jgi:hypothetical protein